MEETFKLSTDPFFVEKVRDIVGLYLNPPEETRALVLCVDEPERSGGSQPKAARRASAARQKSQDQALERTQPLLPMRPGQSHRRTHDYIRHWTTSLFVALDIATGKVIGQCHRRLRHQEVLPFLKKIDQAVPADLEVHLVLDNYATHKTPKVAAWLKNHLCYRRLHH